MHSKTTSFLRLFFISLIIPLITSCGDPETTVQSDHDAFKSDYVNDNYSDSEKKDTTDKNDIKIDEDKFTPDIDTKPTPDTIVILDIDDYVPPVNPDSVKAPVFSVKSGIVKNNTEIIITSDGIIYYTNDGSEPSTSSSKYSSPIKISTGLTRFRAISILDDESSEISEAVYKVSENPTFDGIQIYLEDPGWEAHVWYDIDSDDNWETKTLGEEKSKMEKVDGFYVKEFVNESSITFLFNDGSWNNELKNNNTDFKIEKKGTYKISKTGAIEPGENIGPMIPVVTASPKEGIYGKNQSVTLESDVDPSSIFYTTDGSDPTISGTIYASPIEVTNQITINAAAKNSADEFGPVIIFKYKIDSSIDTENPTITASPSSGHYKDGTTVKFTVSDDRPGVKAYFTEDGSPATTSSKLYNGENITVNNDVTFNFIVIDKYGNKVEKSFNYSTGEINITRFDPRQETIYFLMTARWFDGDESNSVAEEWCSYDPDNPNRAKITDPKDVPWRGDFKGLVEKMDYLKALGFTAIWITPIVQNRSPLGYHGYHGWDFTKEDARLVSPGYDFQRVIDEAHKKDMKIYLDIVLNHSGRYGIKDHAEIKFATDEVSYPTPDEWKDWSFDENAYQNGQTQKHPGNWEYDGIKSPGTINGKPAPPFYRFKDIRPFNDNDLTNYPYLATAKDGSGVLAHQWPTTESFVKTIDNWPGKDLTYEEYKSSPQWHRGYMNGFSDSGMFDIYPQAHLRSIHEDCPELNTENPKVQKYLIDAYNRYIDMGVDGFRVDTVMHVHKKTLNEDFWPKFLQRAEKAKAKRGGADFFIFGEVANFVSNLEDKVFNLRQNNYTWDMDYTEGGTSNNHLLDGNNYRTPDYSKKAPSGNDPYHVSVIDIVAHNGLADSIGEAYGRTRRNDDKYNDATFLTWYADSHDYGPNKSKMRYTGDFAAFWSLIFTYRGIPIVYYGSEIKFMQGAPIDLDFGGADWSLDTIGRAYYGPHLDGEVTATDFGEYTASGKVKETLESDLSKHLIALNKIRLAVPALQMGQYSVDGHSGGNFGFKRRFTGKVGNVDMDSYALVGVGQGNHSWNDILDGTYIDCVTGNEITANGGSISFNVETGGAAGLGVYVLKGLATAAPGKVEQDSPYLN